MTQRMRIITKWTSLGLLLLFLAYLFMNMNIWRYLLQLLFPSESSVIYPRATLFDLAKEHTILVAASSILAVAAGLGAGLFATRPAGRDFLPTINSLVSLAQTFPPVAVLALAVPFLGFGFQPTVIALFLYSVLPVLRNTISGIESVAPEMTEAAQGMGMSSAQVLYRVELPLALPVVLAGIRTSVVINVGTATLGAVAGAGGLGAPIISGLVNQNPAYILEGAAAAALLALTIDRILGTLFSTSPANTTV